jgi:hypothetical protein
MNALQIHLETQERLCRKALLSKILRYASLPQVLACLTLDYHVTQEDLQDTIIVDLSTRFRKLRLCGDCIVLRKKRVVQAYDFRGRRVDKSKEFLQHSHEVSWSWDGTPIKKTNSVEPNNDSDRLRLFRAHLSNVSVYVYQLHYPSMVCLQSNVTQKIVREFSTSRIPAFACETNGLLVLCRPARLDRLIWQFRFYDLVKILPDMTIHLHFSSKMKSCTLVGRNLLFILLDDRSCHKLCLSTKSVEKTSWRFDEIASNATHLVGLSCVNSENSEKSTVTILKFG